MIRSFPWREHVWMAFLEPEIRASVLKRETAAGGDYGATEPAVVAIYKRHAVALGVSHGEVDSITVGVRG